MEHNSEILFDVEIKIIFRISSKNKVAVRMRLIRKTSPKGKDHF